MKMILRFERTNRPLRDERGHRIISLNCSCSKIRSPRTFFFPMTLNLARAPSPFSRSTSEIYRENFVGNSSFDVFHAYNAFHPIGGSQVCGTPYPWDLRDG
jgi:hypothetical protein